jgi:hypothetical protein
LVHLCFKIVRKTQSSSACSNCGALECAGTACARDVAHGRLARRCTASYRTPRPARVRWTEHSAGIPVRDAGRARGRCHADLFHSPSAAPPCAIRHSPPHVSAPSHRTSSRPHCAHTATVAALARTKFPHHSRVYKRPSPLPFARDQAAAVCHRSHFGELRAPSAITATQSRESLL